MRDEHVNNAAQDVAQESRPALMPSTQKHHGKLESRGDQLSHDEIVQRETDLRLRQWPSMDK